MARLDRQLLARIQADGDAARARERELQEALASLWEAREEARRERANLEARQTLGRHELSGVRRERQQVESRIVELEANARRLTDLLADLEHQRLTGAPRPAQPGGPFASLSGQLDWPVAGEIVRPFGRSVHPEFKTVTLHNGITMAAPRGAPVFAVAGGSVEFVDRLPGYGACVIVDHGDGYYSLYAHTQAVLVAPGTRVTAGQMLAEVGVAEGEGRSLLYFEIRRGKTPQDPLRWLRPRR
jgi:septal ring factor EnvC (AmiA/AmiB activator)